MKKLYGVITAMTTPFDADNRLNVDALECQTEFLIEKGINCLYPAGTTGEMYLMDAATRKKVAETVVRKADHRVTVYIHVGAMTLEETTDLALHAYQIGADGVGVVTPSYFSMSEQGMIDYYKKVSGVLPSDFPIYVYVIPQLSGNDITPETMQKISDSCSNIIGVKYSYPDMRRLQRYIRINNGEFSVVFGADELFLPALVMGAAGTVSGCSGPVPEPFVQTYKRYLQGDLEGAGKAQNIANDVVRIMRAGTDMSIFKNILKFRGIEGGHMHTPLPELSEAEIEKLHNEIQPFIRLF